MKYELSNFRTTVKFHDAEFEIQAITFWFASPFDVTAQTDLSRAPFRRHMNTVS